MGHGITPTDSDLQQGGARHSYLARPDYPKHLNRGV